MLPKVFQKCELVSFLNVEVEDTCAEDVILFPNFCALKALHLRNCNFVPEPLNGNALKLTTVKLVNSNIQLDRWCALYELQTLEYDKVADSLN